MKLTIDKRGVLVCWKIGGGGSRQSSEEMAAALALALATALPSSTPRRHVDPLIGTGGLAFGVGGDPPGAQRPFGLVKFSPDTSPANPKLWLEFEHYGGASFMDEYINAFSLLHMVGPGALDLGTLGVMPIGEPGRARQLHGARARYSHTNESAAPGRYRVALTPAGAEQPLTVDLTATHHVAAIRLTPAPGATPPETLSLLIDPRHTLQASSPDPGADSGAQNCSITVDTSAGAISGHLIDRGGLTSRIPSSASPSPFTPGDASPPHGGLDLWFHAVFPGSKLDASCSGLVESDGALRFAAGQQPLSAAGNVSAVACLPLAGRNSVTALIGVSTISATHARRNLEAEVGGRDFDALVTEAEKEWDERLGVLEVVDEPGEEPLGPSLLTPFWTAVYHTLMAPSTYSEVGGEYMGFDQRVHTLQDAADRQLSDMSIWDVSSTQVYRLSILLPVDRVRCVGGGLRRIGAGTR